MNNEMKPTSTYRLMNKKEKETRDNPLSHDQRNRSVVFFSHSIMILYLVLAFFE